MELECPLCRSGFWAEVHNDNEMFCCPDCNGSFVVHGNKAFPAGKIEESSPAGLKISCPGCQQHYNVSSSYCNRPINCQVCSRKFIVLGAPPRSAPPPQSAPPRPKVDFVSIPTPRPQSRSEGGAGNARNFQDVANEIKSTVKSKAAAVSEAANNKNGKFSPARLLLDFLNFRLMIVPLVLKWIWMLVAVSTILAGIGAIIGGIREDSFMGVLAGVGLMLFGPFITHMVFELFLLFFSIHDILKENRDK